MQSSNPAMGVINRAAAGEFNFGGTGDIATLSGATTKSVILIALTCVTGYLSMLYTFGYMYANNSVPNFLMIGGVIVSIIVATVTIFKPQLATFTAPLYAVCEGATLGVISAIFELKYPGIVATAVLSTFAVVLTMLFLWKYRIIVPTARFRSVVMGATLGICLLYLANVIMHLFGLPLLPSTGPLAIIVSLVVCTIAALNLVMDFENFEESVAQGLPKYFEYFCAFSLLVTICWLYIEILRLLSVLNRE